MPKRIRSLEQVEKRRIANCAAKREWRKANRETDRKRALEQYRKDPKAKQATMKAYRDKNRVSHNDYFKEWSATTQGRAKKLVRMAAARAKKAGVPYDLDWQWLHEKLLCGHCEATGLELQIGKGISPWAPSLDRIEGSKGYVKSNVRVVVYVFNMAKSSFSDCDVEKLCRAFVERLSESGNRPRNHVAPAARPADSVRTLYVV